MSFQSSSNKPVGSYFAGKRTRFFSLLGMFIALVLIAVAAASVGSVKIPFLTTLRILLDQVPLLDMAQTWHGNIATIVLEIRLPRVILAGLVGAALATAGATYQGLFRNPLADPYLIGVAQGASLGAVIGFLLPATWHNLGGNVIPIFAFSGALISTIVVYFLARVGKILPVQRCGCIKVPPFCTKSSIKRRLPSISNNFYPQCIRIVHRFHCAGTMSDILRGREKRTV